MFLLLRHFPRPAMFAVPLSGLLMAAPAKAASARGSLENVQVEVRKLATEAGEATAAFWQLLVAGNMAAIQQASFALSGLVALTGLWLLMRPGPDLEIELDDVESESDAAPPANEVAAEADGERPMRLLEAIAAAKAQLAISAAEKKHTR